jgi:hypothetical protein
MIEALHPPGDPLVGEERPALRATVRRLIAEEVTPRHAPWGRDGRVRRRL